MDAPRRAGSQAASPATSAISTALKPTARDIVNGIGLGQVPAACGHRIHVPAAGWETL